MSNPFYNEKYGEDERHELTNNKYSIVVGNDHAVGLFIQVWPTKKGTQSDIDEEDYLIDKDEMFDGLTRKEMVNIANQYGF